jgi:hypothetical protein
MKFLLAEYYSSPDLLDIHEIHTVLTGIDLCSFVSFVRDCIFQEEATPTDICAVDFETAATSGTVCQYYKAPSLAPTCYQSMSLHS